MAKQDDFIRATVRLPPDLVEEIKARAETSERSFNAEIIARLEISIEEDRKREITSDQDPFALIVQATEGIGRMAALINKALIPLGVEAGKIKVASGESVEETAAKYSSVLDMLPAEDRELVGMVHKMGSKRRRMLMRLAVALQDSKDSENDDGAG